MDYPEGSVLIACGVGAYTVALIAAVSDEVLEQFRAALARFEALGAIIEPRAMPRAPDFYKARAGRIMAIESWNRLRAHVEKPDSRVHPVIRGRILAGRDAGVGRRPAGHDRLGVGAASRQTATAAVGPRQGFFNRQDRGVDVDVENFRSEGQAGSDQQPQTSHYDNRFYHVDYPVMMDIL
ncbi:MAG: hypothetical protein P8Y91_09020 [Desulfuromonadales bacterium]